MPTRVLFVDDEPNVLSGLRRMLRPLADEWSMEFVGSGAEALSRLDQEPFDVVVSDMRMPRMSGGELLAEVRVRHPQVVRIILSGHSEQEMVLRAMGSTHQYLAKPCDPETLRLTVRRAAALRTLLDEPRLKQVVSGMSRVPSMPALFHELVAAVQSPVASLQEVGRIIEKDPGMTAQILRLINSAYFGLRREIFDPVQAVTMLGLATVSVLVLTVKVFAEADARILTDLGLEGLWSHSLRTAQYAKTIAASIDDSRDLSDQVFSAGILHDIGMLVLATNYPDRYRQSLQRARAKQTTLCMAEEDEFGANHGDVGAYILGLWGLPCAIVETSAFHEAPSRCVDETLTPVTLVHVADVLDTENPADPVHPSPRLDDAHLARLSLADRIDHWRELCAPRPSSRGKL